MDKEGAKAARRKHGDQDPVRGKRINRNKAHVAVKYKGEALLCCPLCQAAFERDPERYLR